MLTAQVVADFENFGLLPGEFIAEDATGLGFQSGNVNLPNEFNANYGSWTGWAISATTDSTTPGFMNQFSSITGGGFDNYSDLSNYAVSFTFDENIIRLTDGEEFSPGIVDGMYITNSTFAFLSILNGDAFAKQFGGETGDDPDFFSVVFRSYVNGVQSTDSVEFFLADYRFANNNEDFIVCLLYTSPSPRDQRGSRMPSSA